VFVVSAAFFGGCSGDGGGASSEGPPQAYFPTWGDVAPTDVITHDHNGSLSDIENGTLLKDAIAALTPGQRLEIGAGTYSVAGNWNLALQGTADAPIWIVAQDGAQPVITKPDALNNVVNIGDAGQPTRYVVIRGLEFTGGSVLMRIYDCAYLWVDQCYLHDGGAGGLTANAVDTHHLYITRNEIHDPGGPSSSNEGMYLGANYGAVVMHTSVVALNHVHDCYGTQGDGIELKQGSYNNLIAENNVHDTGYPCIIAYGTGGLPPNIIERNTCCRSDDNVMQVQGEAVVRNNLLVAGAGSAFSSVDHQDTTVNLVVVNNTMVNAGYGANLSDWNGRAGMVFANNAVYSRDSYSIRFPYGSTGVTVAGNVAYGPVMGVAGGYASGAGLGDFVDVAWDASAVDATPAAASALAGAADAAHEPVDDITGAERTGAPDAGAFDAD